jgi:hypothetical protein
MNLYGFSLQRGKGVRNLGSKIVYVFCARFVINLIKKIDKFKIRERPYGTKYDFPDLQTTPSPFVTKNPTNPYTFKRLCNNLVK